MATFKRSALIAGAFWAVPLVSLVALRAIMFRAERAAEKPALPTFRAGKDGQVRSPSPPSMIAALTSLPYILQSHDSNPASGVVSYRRGEAAPGLNFFFPWSLKPPRAFLMDLDGRVVWQWSLADYLRDDPHPWLENAVLLPDGCVLFSLQDRGLIKVDRDSKVLWESKLGLHHDLWPGWDGRLYAMTHGLEVVPEIHPTIPIQMDTVAVLSGDGKVEKKIRVFDLLKSSGYGYLLPRLQDALIPPGRKYLDVFHLNHVELLDGSLASRSPIYRRGNLLISIRNLNAIAIVDGASEKIVWLWGPGNLTFQHDPRILPNGQILIFDNGTSASEVVQVDPLTLRVTWRYAPTSGFFSKIAGSVQRLSNGNTLITESMAGHAIEVNDRGETVWRYSNPEITPKGLRNGIIRMTRVEPSTLTFLGKPATETEAAR